MNQGDVETFLAVVQYGSLTKAAENIFISQSTLSQRIYNLEREVGVKLIERHKGVRHIVLTETGRCFFQIAEKWQSLQREIQQLPLKTVRPILRVAAVYSITTCILSDIYLHFQRSLSQPMQLTIITLPSREAYQQIVAGEIDVAFIANPHHLQRISCIPIFKEKMVLVSSASYEDVISPVQLDSSQEVYLNWGRGFHMWHDYWFGIAAHPMVITDNIQIIKTAVNNEKAWACVPVTAADMLAADFNIRITELVDGPPDRITYMLTREAEPLEQVKMFARYLCDNLRDRQGVELIAEGGELSFEA